MAKTKTKKMTLSYWMGLSQGSKYNALSYVFPLHPETVAILLKEKPNVKLSPWWRLVWQEVRIPTDHSHYKTVINGDVYLC